jgi:hypothetical protein
MAELQKTKLALSNLCGEKIAAPRRFFSWRLFVYATGFHNL